jgi:hypothetical protein
LCAFERGDVMGIFLWIIKEIKEILIDESNGEKSVSADGKGNVCRFFRGFCCGIERKKMFLEIFF